MKPLPGAALRSRLVALVSAAAAGFTGLFFAFSLARYGFAFPFMDQWEFVVTLQQAWNGELSWTHLVSQHNEHRVLFPRLLMLALALPSDWAIELEVAANLVLGMLLFICAALLLAPQAKSAVFVIPLGLLVFNLHQWQNYAWGWQMQVLMNAAAVAGGTFALQRMRGCGARTAAGIALGGVATFSFASGLVCWLALLPAVWWGGSGESTRARRVALAAWLAAFAVCAGLYLWDYHRPVDHPSLLDGLRAPVRTAAYVTAYLGGAVAAWRPWAATAAGTAGLTVAAALVVWSLRHGKARGIAPFVSLLLYSLGAAGLTALGRGSEGVAQALSSRYGTPAMLFWVGALGVGLTTLRHAGPRTRAALLAAAVVLSASLALNTRHGFYALQERHRHYAPAAAALADGDRALLHRLYPHPDLLDERLEFLRDNGLTAVFRATPSTR